MVIPNGGALNRNMVPLTPSGLMSLGAVSFGVFFFVFFSVGENWATTKNKQGFFTKEILFLEVKFYIDFCSLATFFVVFGFLPSFFSGPKGVGTPWGGFQLSC